MVESKATLRDMYSAAAARFDQQIKRLEGLACPSAEDVEFFNQYIRIATTMGMGYRDRLEFVIRMRPGGAS